jgi:multidrug efflux pump subunit AcrA (membrane-fusion protein)
MSDMVTKQTVEGMFQAMENARLSKQMIAEAQRNDAAQRSALDTRSADIRSQNQAAQKTAVSQLMQQMQQRGQQAKLAMKNAPAPPSITPNAAPLKQITGVSLMPGMAGANNAQSAIFVSPEASQSQFAVGAPIGGGNIGQRQKGSTTDIVSQPDNLNSSRKGKF